MPDDLNDLSLSARPDLTIQSLAEIDASTYELPSPTLVANAMTPEVLSRKRRVRLYAVSDETTSRVSVHGQQEWDEKMVRIPECFVALLSDLRMSSGEHEKHA